MRKYKAFYRQNESEIKANLLVALALIAIILAIGLMGAYEVQSLGGVR